MSIRNSHSIDLVVFDLGRVLVRIADDWLHAAELARIELRLHRDCPVFLPGMREAVDLNERGHIDAAEFDRRIAGLVDGLHVEQVDRMIQVWLRGCYAGTGELLAELHQRGVATACLSNTNSRHWRLMFDPAAANGVDFSPLHQLRHKFASHLMRSRKPEPEIYARMEAAVGVRPDRILFFDDLPDNITVARQRGWRAEWVPCSLDNTIPHIRACLEHHDVLRRSPTETLPDHRRKCFHPHPMTAGR